MFLRWASRTKACRAASSLKSIASPLFFGKVAFSYPECAPPCRTKILRNMWSDGQNWQFCRVNPKRRTGFA